MHKKRVIQASLTIALLLGLTGCETQPEDIAKWKAEGNSAKLITVLKDSRQFMRIDAIDALAELKTEDAVVPLGELLKDPDVVIVHEALDALAEIGTPAVEPYMIEAITFDTQPSRLIAAKMLGTLKSTQAIDALALSLNDKYENIAVAAAVSLGQIGDPKAIEPLAETSLKGSVSLRGASIASIRKIGGTEAVKPLIAVMGDLSIKVRNEAVAGLVEAGDVAESSVLKLLNSDNSYERESALIILKKIDKVPTTGKDAAWYQLSTLALGENPKTQRAEARKLAEIENGMDAFISALSHPSRAIREHAFLALEAIGEPATEPLLAAAANRATPAAKAWLDSRSDWAGAPAWQLDLWAAATALNPAFELKKRNAMLLKKGDKETVKMLESKEFRPVREEIPLLIKQMASIESTDEKILDKAAYRQQLAFRKLRAYKQRSKFPLIASINDDDLQIAAHAAEILVTIDDDERATQAVINGFSARIEKGDPLTGSPFHDAMLKLNNPEVNELLLKIRPNAAEAIKTAEKKYPGVRISSIPVPPSDKVIQAEPFRLKYIVNGKTKELKVVFRPDEEGNWVPNPPLPDELP